MRVLGIDTSNYTTSIAVADETGYRHGRTILEVKTGERGLRQSDALFLHTVNLPRLFSELDIGKTDAVSYSEKPRDIEGSYMPCFLAGKAAATAAVPVAAGPRSHGPAVVQLPHDRAHALSAMTAPVLYAVLHRLGAQKLRGGRRSARERISRISYLGRHDGASPCEKESCRF